MSKQQPQRGGRAPQPAPSDQLRRIGRAVIALAQAQLEADAQAEHGSKNPEAAKSTPGEPGRRARRSTGDAS